MAQGELDAASTVLKSHVSFYPAYRSVAIGQLTRCFMAGIKRTLFRQCAVRNPSQTGYMPEIGRLCG